MTHSPASGWSSAFLGELIARGVTDFVVSPGSRSRSLALAALEWERASEGLITVHVVIDERSAGFRALGLALETQRPAVCIATSGSAPLHYMPALAEARHAGVPMMVISADRPSELQGVGANQTTDQSALFGGIGSLLYSYETEPFFDTFGGQLWYLGLFAFGQFMNSLSTLIKEKMVRSIF